MIRSQRQLLRDTCCKPCIIRLQQRNLDSAGVRKALNAAGVVTDGEAVRGSRKHRMLQTRVKFTDWRVDQADHFSVFWRTDRQTNLTETATFIEALELGCEWWLIEVCAIRTPELANRR